MYNIILTILIIILLIIIFLIVYFYKKKENFTNPIKICCLYAYYEKNELYK